MRLEHTTPHLMAAASAPSADNSQHWLFNTAGDSLSVRYRTRRGLDPFGPQGHATLIGIGALSENLAQATEAGNDALEWSGDSLSAPYLTLSLRKTRKELLPDHPLFARHTNRFGYRAETPATSLIDSLTANSEGSTRLCVLPAGKAFDHLSELTRVCCKARFCSQELHEWLMGSLRFSPEEVESGDGLDVSTIDLPPGGSLFMRMIKEWKHMAFLNRFHIYRFMADVEIRKLRNASMLICVVGPGGYRDSLDAGRLMQRTWIELNQQGWSVHPFYVVADQQTRYLSHAIPADWARPVGQALDALPGILSLDAGERLHIVLRVGRPLVKNPPRSRRLPLEQLLAAC